MSQVLRQLPKINDANLLVGTETSDDAAVYRLSDELALIQTVDFFTPMVDDPYLFGQIAAANALSDVYAMGGTPRLALNVVCFPSCLPPEVLGEILRGGAAKVAEAGAVIAGGHTVQDDEPKYGLAVTGIVHPGQVISNATARPGDVLVLTKPLGTGIVNTAIKADLAAAADCQAAVQVMTELNQGAARAMREIGVNACTDITGFGLLGHGAEMARGSGVSLVLQAGRIPVLSGTRELARMGIIPAGAYNNRNHLGEAVQFDQTVTRADQDILYDPQTSGGLLLAVPAEREAALLARLADYGVAGAATIGRAEAAAEILIQVEGG